MWAAFLKFASSTHAPRADEPKTEPPENAMNASLINDQVRNANVSTANVSRGAGLLQTRTTTRLAGLAAALVLSVGMVGALTQTMNIDQFGKGAPMVHLEAVVVMPPAAKPVATEIARADAEGVKRQTN
jgi:tetrahydromethanopterin S-methyltransferase subunit F